MSRRLQRIAAEVLAADPAIEVLVVDDNSPDGTGDLVAEQAARDSRIHLLRRPGKLGLGTAYLAGFRFGLEGDYGCVLTMDCDGSHKPCYIPSILAAMSNCDLVIGSRYIPGGGIMNWPPHRRLLSAFANFLHTGAIAFAGARLHGGFSLRIQNRGSANCFRAT